MDILISPTEPYEVKEDFGEYGISAPHLPSDYGWYVKGYRSLVQRKHIPGDFLASMEDGRLARDMQILLENIEQGGKSYLLTEGFWSCDKEGMILNPIRPSGWSYEKISAQISTIQEMGIRLLHSPNISLTALVIINQVRWEMKEDHSSLSHRPGPVTEWGKPSYASYTIWSFQGIPGVGADIAEILFKAAPTWEKLVAMDIADFQELKHFGKKRAERVYKFIHNGKL